MSKMKCKCGAVVSDVVYPCETEGYLIGQKSWDYVFSKAASDIQKYIECVQSDNAEEWIKANFTEDYPKGLPHESIINDYLTGLFMNHELSVAECSKCGRLWIQEKPEENKYESYKPDNEKYNQVCDKVKRENA